MRVWVRALFVPKVSEARETYQASLIVSEFNWVRLKLSIVQPDAFGALRPFFLICTSTLYDDACKYLIVPKALRSTLICMDSIGQRVMSQRIGNFATMFSDSVSVSSPLSFKSCHMQARRMFSSSCPSDLNLSSYRQKTFMHEWRPANNPLHWAVWKTLPDSLVAHGHVQCASKQKVNVSLTLSSKESANAVIV